MANPGQPTLYKREYCELAHNYCLLGATNELLGDFFGVARRTIQNGIAPRPYFAAAAYGGRAVADARVSAMPATKRERTLWERQQKTSGGKGGKGGNLQSFGNNGLFDDGATRRKPAETPCRNFARETVRIFLSHPRGAVQRLDTDIACGNCGNSSFPPATTPRQRGCYSATMTDQALPDQIPDRLSTNPKSPHYDEALLTRGVGIKFDGQEKTNVEEYCVSEGWIRVAVGKTVDRKGNPLTIKLTGKVEPYFQK
jgi:Protein of unknown function (DUF3297)